ncbi:Rpp14/Pop5 family protein [Acidianus ambivalens]|uniref:Ribonuclease P protein component 2 n=1 Tax=Acidianus ambivalens TaxID=2283 RepID=A0A650CXN1_ACIAM|nr:Rpp14/Pop5 family protein [Acidianus ambivalens]MQL54822.1 ribonuclease P [Acidianus ambivalens]QGR22611.1 ribonuclease P [Acidianus ambivalens]
MLVQIIIDFVLITWLSILTYLILAKNNLYIRKIKNKKDIRSKRYIVFYIISEDQKISPKNVEDAIRSAVKEFLGSMWLEISNPRVIIYLNETNEGIISTNRAGYKAVIASLPLVKAVDGKKVLIVPKRTTGSLKKAKRLIGIR